MKKLLFLWTCIVGFILLQSCQDEKLSFLDVSAVNFPLNTMTITVGLTLDDTLAPGKPPVFPWDPPATPQPSKYYHRIKNKSPWIAKGFYGSTVEGARPLTVTLANVKASEGAEAGIEILKKELTIVGECRMSIPFETKLPIGEYLLSFKISNIHGSEIVEDVFTIIVTDVKNL